MTKEQCACGKPESPGTHGPTICDTSPDTIAYLAQCALTSNPDNELSPRIREFGSHDRFGQPITTQYLRIDEYERLKLERDFHQRTSVKLGDINVARAKQIREVLKSWSLTGDDGLPVETSACRYEAAIGAVCNKCGRIHDFGQERCAECQTPRLCGVERECLRNRYVRPAVEPDALTPSQIGQAIADNCELAPLPHPPRCECRLCLPVKASAPLDREAVNALALQCAQASAVVRNREWNFDRYRNGKLKAQGVTVHAATEAEAWEKARSLLHIDGNMPTDELRLQPLNGEPKHE